MRQISAHPLLRLYTSPLWGWHRLVGKTSPYKYTCRCYFSLDNNIHSLIYCGMWGRISECFSWGTREQWVLGSTFWERILISKIFLGFIRKSCPLEHEGLWAFGMLPPELECLWAFKLVQLEHDWIYAFGSVSWCVWSWAFKEVCLYLFCPLQLSVGVGCFLSFLWDMPTQFPPCALLIFPP